MRTANSGSRQRDPRTALALFVAALGLCILPGCGPQEPEKPGDVVLISVDTLRPDHLGIYGYARDTSPAAP